MATDPANGATTPERQTWELRLLNDVAGVLWSSIDAGEVLQQGLDVVANAFAARSGVLHLHPTDSGPMVLRAVPGASGEGAGSTLSVLVTAGAEVMGSLTLVSALPRRFSDDDERVLTAIGRKFGVVAANRRLFERVHRAKVQWEQTIDAISDPIALFDREARTMRTNAALAASRGWAIRETQGRTCAEVGLCGGGCPDCLVGRAIRDGVRLSGEVATPDGRVLLVTTLPVPEGDGAAVLFAKEITSERTRERQLQALSRDLAAANAEMAMTLDRLRATQAQLVQAEKLSAIGQLVAGVAHELNNPLTGVIGYARLVRDAVVSSPALAARPGLLDDVSRIQSEADRAAGIVRNLLTFSGRHTAARRPHDITHLCHRVVDLRAYESRVNGIDVVVEYASGLPPVHVDGGQIQQALLNLVLNAEQAMAAAPLKRLRIEALADPACSAILLRVSDTGHGIEAGHLARVFDPFFTTRGVGEGTGLGLSIVYGIVRDHGGQIWVESVRGHGAAFSIRLPVRDAEAGAGLALVAHADAVTRDFTAAVLAGWGYTVRRASTPREAIESLVEDDVRVVLADRSTVDGDPEAWREPWARVRAQGALILLERSVEDLGALRQALLAARRRPPLDDGGTSALK